MSWLAEDALNYCISFNNLSSWLSVQGTRDLVSATGCAVSFLPMVATLGNVANDSRQSDDPLAQYKARRARARNLDAAAETRRQSERLGISIAQAGRSYQGRFAALGLLQLRGAPAIDSWSYVERVFSAAYRDGRDIDDQAVIETLLGCSLAVDDTALQDVESVLAEAGIFTSPGYLYRGERFHGRQHLPLLRWMISGASGTAPV